ncbi:3-hydroxyacyl-CoA dehydrogenase NAD-binding domain-containing protein [Albimonas sp. CAU 1670]|uniref:3-hydroxyacyl-CoA dehydrogenase NAD-binding domain-containing protein n=1 Tax=Albimonas sp. CAU 1670 TaxID=3032599 RepID=UPI0023DB372C|nr:3-hydroxyacyl-CoA dehydrogenase NAD-binding domain-containing protein [Albimonas sp. CAU 1670]MDF2234675.1 3-hydroxyacyl-CoA dehydrogenase NAD-binding domain-containing protein [Albimonas sp. CAU 1670]
MADRLSDFVTYERVDGVAVIRTDNPPVNALGADVRAGIVAGMERFDADPDAAIALIHCDGRTFHAGADIKEFGTKRADPQIWTLCDRIEAATKPVVATLHGTALGGGLEVAIAAHWRIAQRDAKVGLPEVHLGVIPAAGATQRAPRLMGAARALEAITTGRHIPAPEARDLGLIDELDDSGDALAAGLAYARRLAAEGKGVRRTGEMPVPDATPELFAEWRERAVKTGRGLNAVLYCVEAVEGCLLPFEEGLRHETAVSDKSHADPQRDAMVHAFFGERAVAKIPEASAAPRRLETVGVVGGGTMGAGIAAAALNAGLKVVMVEMDAEALARGEANLRRNFASSVAKGRMSQQALDELLATRWTGAADFAALSDVDLVVEAVFEKMSVKKEVFAKLDAVVREGAVLATNTSYLDVNEIAAVTRRPQDVLGLHFFSPAHVMRLLEVVVGAKTLPEVVATGFALARRMGKIAVRAGVCDGFIGNRILGAYLKAADMMVEDGASPYEVDAAVRGFGYPMGPFQMGDLAGLDIGYLNRRGKDETRDPGERYSEGFLDRMYENGWLGQKTGIGFYDYAGGARSGPPNPQVLPMIEAERRRLGINARSFTREEILRRYIAAMTNEAAKVVGEGIALRPLDVDMTAIAGYGYPRWRGGPMHHADTVGLAKILSDLQEFAQEDPGFWAPAPLLERLVAEGRSFADLNAPAAG